MNKDWQTHARGRAVAALLRAAQQGPINFNAFDLNNDGAVAFDELCVLLIENVPGLAPWNLRNVRFTVDVNIGGVIGQTLTVDVITAFAGINTPFYQIAHESSHSLGLGAASDLRGHGEQNNLLTLMSGYSFNSDDQRSVHLDAFHKHVLGWTDAWIYSLATPREVSIPVTHAARPDAPMFALGPRARDEQLLPARIPHAQRPPSPCLR